ncbi:cytochrome P450 [Aspergillus candidus]|uniref:Cytochrome P450 n=1 Tax=Aspergillus candidus TaxID=41067 RepID=A0A2I2FNN9_ASPCN|nr:cytochrome P450 [Aspergillus candidus]PLB42242.1 cytochrome P450 [Aspergillus candidus]
MRYFHSLSNYPGPLLATLTNTYKAYYVYNLTLHEKLLGLHMRYGPVVRIGPNHLHTWEGEAIAPIYRGGRNMGKTEFYNAFTAFNPNLFGGTNEDIHSLRRRQLSHGFSQASITKLEPLIEGQLKILINKLQMCAKTGEILDLKQALSLYVLDILGEVAFSKPFDAQAKGHAEELHAINDHLLLSGVIGELPLQDFWKMLSRISPLPWMRRLMKSRNNLKRVCGECVRFKINNPSDRPDLLRSLVEAVDPQSGVAGSHSTSGTLTLLFWHLVQNPEIMKLMYEEIHTVLGPLREDQIAYPITGLEASLRYTMACVRENFRLNPVFTMPLWRRVGYPTGVDIGEHHIPHDTSICISNYVLHHNPSIWGHDHNTYNPTRWLDEKYHRENSRFLIPFSIGHRMCIGKNLAMTNILKTVTTLLSLFEIEAVVGKEGVAVRSSGIGEMEGDFPVRVRIRRASLR